MPKFEVMLEGKNFPLKVNDETVAHGFYTIRKVKAKNIKEAELAAVALVKSDEKLINSLDKTSDLVPMIYLESYAILPFWSKLGGTGYTFYPMDTHDS